MWTREQLEETVRTKLGDRPLIIVSNREPYIHALKEKKIVVKRPAGGAVTALDPVMKACGGTWVAHGSGDADKKVVDKKDKIRVPPDESMYTLKRVWLSKEEEDGYYYGFSNKALWPLCHIVHTRPTFNESDWTYYRQVNQKFAKAILEEVGHKKAIVWIQDYHLALLPKLLKDVNPNIICGHFWHIPWPNPEAFRVCPQKKEILEGLLANDLLGFHIRYHCYNFLDTVDLEMEARIDRERTSVTKGGHETLLRAYPISMDFEHVSGMADTKEVEAKMEQLTDELSLDYEFVIMGLDRIDYTKGIPERIRAIDRLLEKYREYKGRLVFIQFGALSRVHIKRYRELNDEINEVVEEVNWKHSTDSWSPIHLYRKDLTFEEKLALYRLSNVCVVSSLHDGMNLVAKEYISARSDLDGVVVLSQFTGASRELKNVIFINPYDTEDFADRIREALEMKKDERSKYMKRLRSTVRQNNIYKWAGNIILDLSKLQLGRKPR